nr:cytochrome c oxidase subunit 3 [Diplostomoidea sp. MSB para 30071]
MSLIPLYSSWGFMLFILSAFLWKLIGVWFFFLYIALAIILLVKEVGMSYYSHNWGFMIFILMELFTFISLFFVSHYCMSEVMFEDVEYVSEFDEFPLLGSIILLSSSILVTGFHFNYGLAGCHWYLFFGVVLGFCFMLVQFFEFMESSYYFVDCPYYVVAYSTVGLHFLHVLGGVLVLFIILCLGYYSLNSFYVEMSIWYWHFVDYVWLLVFMVFYYPTILWVPWFFL